VRRKEGRPGTEGSQLGVLSPFRTATSCSAYFRLHRRWRSQNQAESQRRQVVEQSFQRQRPDPQSEGEGAIFIPRIFSVYR